MPARASRDRPANIPKSSGAGFPKPAKTSLTFNNIIRYVLMHTGALAGIGTHYLGASFPKPARTSLTFNNLI